MIMEFSATVAVLGLIMFCIVGALVWEDVEKSKVKAETMQVIIETCGRDIECVQQYTSIYKGMQP